MHTSIAGGLPESLKRASALGCDTLQIFSHNPRSWAVREIPRAEALEFRRLRAKLGLGPVFIHACYLINLTSPDGEVQEKSVRMLGEELRRADALGAEYVVLHAGAPAEADEIRAARLIVDSIKDATGPGRFRAKLLLENTAGGRGDITANIRSLLELAGAAGAMAAFDTCHAFAAGYDIGSPGGLESLAAEMKRAPRGAGVRLVHMNDSKGAPGSHLDRHEHIGAGRIGLAGLRAFLRFAPMQDAPLILETPRDDPQDDPRNLSALRGLLREDPPPGKRNKRSLK